MKILFVASKYDYGIKERGFSFEWENFYPELCKLAEVVEFDFITIMKESSQKEMNENLKNMVTKINPEIVFFVLTNNEFEIETLKYIKESTDSISINWFCDDQWRFNNFSNIFAPYFNYVITTDKLALKKYQNIGVENVLLSQWASNHLIENESIGQINYEWDVSFVGLKNIYRDWIVEQLRNEGINVSCFGYGWENGRVSNEKMKEIFQKSKINLNISNSINYDIRFVFSSPKNVAFMTRHFINSSKSKDSEQIKARHFEIPGAGGFQLTNYVPFLEDYFHIGKEIQVYSSIKDLKEKIEYYLENEHERDKITAKSYQLVSGNHTYHNRFSDILTSLNISKR